MLISSIVVFAQCFDFFSFNDDADENSFFTVFATADDEEFSLAIFVATNDEKYEESDVFDVFSSLDEDEADENKYSDSESFSIVCL